jgi:hypothetical protein
MICEGGEWVVNKMGIALIQGLSKLLLCAVVVLRPGACFRQLMVTWLSLTFV